jgi:hypothetical protein
LEAAPSRAAATRTLRALRVRREAMPVLRRLLADGCRHLRVAELEDDQVVECLARALAEGALCILARAEPPNIVIHEWLAPGKVAAPVLGPLPEPEISWIEVEVVDETDRPVPHVVFQLLGSGGVLVDWGATDAEGVSRIGRLDAGEYTLVFPDHDEELLRPIAVRAPAPQGESRPMPAAAPAPLPPAASAPSLGTGWILIEVVDELGAPVSGVRYEVRSDEGVVRAGVTSAESVVWIEGLAIADCEITFPDLDEGAIERDESAARPCAPLVSAVPPAQPQPLLPVVGAPSRGIDWIQIEVVDERGAPVSGVRYEVRSAEGVVQSGVTTAESLVWIEGLDAPSCEVHFPDLDESAIERVKSTARPLAPLVAAVPSPLPAPVLPALAGPSLGDRWLVVELADELDAPLAGMRYEIWCGERLVSDGRTRADGPLFFSDLDASECIVVFPDLDADACQRVP